MCDHHQLAGPHCKTSFIISCLVITTHLQSKSIAGNTSIWENQTFWKHLRIDGGAGDWIFSGLMRGSLVLGDDGSYMPHLANTIVACAAVFYCSQTNQYVDVTWVESSTKKAANNCLAKILGACSTQLLIRQKSLGTTYWGMVLLLWRVITWGWCDMATVPGLQCWRSNHNQMSYGTSKALWLCQELEDGCNTCTTTQRSTCWMLRCPQHSE
jgi:hypothetical protein